jgi:hypothetical protein
LLDRDAAAASEFRDGINNNRADSATSQLVAAGHLYAPWSVLDSRGYSSSINMTSGNQLRSSTIDWSQFKQFLLQRTNSKTTGERLRYSKQFVSVLQTGDAQPLLQVTPDKRIHAMKALASLSRFLGCYDTWLQIRQRYNLKWSTGNESLATFQRFFLDDKRTLESMLEWVRQAIRVVPAPMAAVIKFNVLTGLRPSEAIASVRLLNNFSAAEKYYNPERQTLEHFRFPAIFLRRTKSAYISIITKEQLSGIGILGCKTPTPTTTTTTTTPTPTYEALRFRLERTGIKCHLGWCRKIYSSYLRQEAGIESEIVDLLSGRVPRTVFARNYFTPSVQYRQKVQKAVDRLHQTISQ